MIASIRGAVFALVLAVSAAAPATLAAEADGKTLYLQRCGPCHLKGGGGTWMLGRRLGEERALLEGRNDLVAPYVTYIVRNGLNVMPRFTRVELTDAELQAIAGYLVTSGSQP